MASVGSGDYFAAGSPIPRRFHGSLSACGQPIPVILGQHPEIVRRFHKIRSHFLNLGQARQPNGRKIRHRNLTARSVLPALRSRQFPELKELITRFIGRPRFTATLGRELGRHVINQARICPEPPGKPHGRASGVVEPITTMNPQIIEVRNLILSSDCFCVVAQMQSAEVQLPST